MDKLATKMINNHFATLPAASALLSSLPKTLCQPINTTNSTGNVGLTNENKISPTTQSIVNYSESQTGENKAILNNEENSNSHPKQSHQKMNEDEPTEQKKTVLRGSIQPKDNQNHNAKRENSCDSLPTRQEPQRQEYLNPQRYWEKDLTLPPPPHYNNSNNNYNSDRNQGGSCNVFSQPPQYPHQQRNLYNNNGNDLSVRPKHISENTRHVSTVGPDGSTFQVTTSSTRHDGEEVHNRTEQNIRLQRMEQLKSSGNIGRLKGTQRPHSLKVFITRVNPEATPEDMEHFLLENFQSLEKVIIRQQPMHHTRHYQSFVIILISKKALNICDFENYDWPDDIKCFPGINNYERNV